MRRHAAAWIGVVLLAVAAPLAARPVGDEPVRLTAVRIEIGRLSPLTFTMMTRELAALLDEAGVVVDWRQDHPSGRTSRDDLRIVFLDSPARGAFAGRAVLAASGLTGPAPTVWVYTPTVVGVLHSRDRSPLDSFLTQRALGVSLGRVVAHELVHLLAPGVPHGTGLMSPRFRPEALNGTRPVLDKASANALASAARSWQTRGGPPPETERRERAQVAAAAAADHAAAR